MARQQEARLKLIADEASYVAGVKRAIASTDKFNRSTKRVNRNPFRSVTRSVVGLAGAYIGAQGLITVVRRSVEEQQESVKVGRQTNAVLKSTKNAAGLSAKAIGDLAQALSEKTAVDDEAIQSAENLLLTFTKIGKDTFPAATKAVLDLSAATGTSLKGASIQVGKALQDPVRGLTALRKSGVNFSTDQTEVIKKLVETGKTAEAQKLILKELATEFGGSAAAQATPLDKLKVTYENLLETIGGYLVPVLNDVATATIKFVEQFRAGKGAGGEFRDTLKGIYDTLRPIVNLLINHPQLVAGAAAAYVAFKATLGSINLFNTLAGGFGSTGKWQNVGAARGTALRLGLAAGLILLVPTISKELSKLSPTLARYSGEAQGSAGKAWGNLGTDLADVLTGGIFARLLGLKPLISSAGKDVGKTLAGGIKQSGPTVYSSLNDLMNKLKKGGLTKAQAFGTVGTTAAGRVAAGIRDEENRVKNALASVIAAAKRKGIISASAFGPIGARMTEGLSAGILRGIDSAVQAMITAVQRVRDAAKKESRQKSPSQVFAEIGEGLVDGLALGMSRTAPLVAAAKNMVKAANPNRVSASGGVKAAMPFGLGTEVGNTQELLAAQYAAANVKKLSGAKTTKGKAAQKKANERAQTRADNRVTAIEAKQAAKQARATAGETLKGFIAGILDQIRQTKLNELMAPVNAARAKRAADAITAGKASVTKRITAAEGQRDSNGNLLPGSPAALKYAREGARLDARIAQAKRQGNLEAVDQLEDEKEALDARYGPKYLATLRDELAQLNEDELEISSEKLATDFAEQFRAGLDAALKALLNGGTVTDFFERLKTVLAGTAVTGPSGVSLDTLPPSVTAGVGEAAALLSGTTMTGKPVAGGIKTWNQRISEFVRTLNKSTTHKASDVAKALGTTQKNVWANHKPLPSGHKMANKVSGGMLTPGALTLVGETGPELIVGGKVMSATRTNRMGGGQGMNITVNAVGAAADDPMLLARQLGWQLATR